MDPRTLDLFRCLQSGPYDEAGFQHIERLLGSQRRQLRAAADWDALEELVQLLDAWAGDAGGGKLTAAALGAAAEIAEQELRQVAWADALRERATAERWRGGVEAATEDAWTEQLARAEQGVEVEATPESVQRLAGLYLQRDAPGDREQAADLYCTLAEVLGDMEGRAWFERALECAPEHPQVRAWLTRQPASGRDSDSTRLSFPEFTHPSGILEAAPQPKRVGPPPLRAAKRYADPSLSQPFSSVSPVVIGNGPKAQARGYSARRWYAAGALSLSAAAALTLFIKNPQQPKNSQPTSQSSVPARVAAPPLPQKPVDPDPTPGMTAPALIPPPLPPPLPPPTAAISEPPRATVQPILSKLTLRGGSYKPATLSTLFESVQPRFDECYAASLKKAPHTKGRLLLGFTVKQNGRVSQVKNLGGSVTDTALIRCSVEALAGSRLAKPRKQAVKIKLPLWFKPV
jgi:hypothetical protein